MTIDVPEGGRLGSRAGYNFKLFARKRKAIVFITNGCQCPVMVIHIKNNYCSHLFQLSSKLDRKELMSRKKIKNSLVGNVLFANNLFKVSALV